MFARPARAVPALVIALVLASQACDGPGRGGAGAGEGRGAVSAAGGEDRSARSGPGVALDSAGLAAMIDSLVPVISRASGLPVRHPVAYTLQSRADARKFIDRQLDEELGPEELRGTERVYKALGMIPDTLDLRSLLLALYAEQVVGYYDAKTDRLYVLAGVPADSAAPVVAHELVHALQDQYTDLDSLVARGRGNDRQVAAQAAAEGEATLVMVAIQTAQVTGRPPDPGSLPDMRGMLAPALEAQNDQFPVFQHAPRIVRETLIFPYLGGAAFVQALFRHRRGDDLPIPFRDLLPQSTEQVMHPESRFIRTRDAPTELTLGPPGDGWSVAYSNGFGEFETSVIVGQQLGEGTTGTDSQGDDAASGWDGDRYALLDGPDGKRALVWYSVWDDPASADRFAAAYRRGLLRRPERAGEVERLGLQGRPAVRIVETAAGGVPAEVGAPDVVALREGG